MNEQFYARDFNVFKPSQTGQGGAMALSFTPIGLLLKIAKQFPGQRKFDWQGATLFSLDIPDIAALLNGLSSKTKVELIHDAAKFAGARNPVKKGLVVDFNAQYNNFFWSLWRKEGEQTISASIPTSINESLVIRTLLAWAVPRILQWDLIELKKEEGQYGAPRQPQQAAQQSNTDDIPDYIKDDPFWGLKEETAPPAAQTTQTPPTQPAPATASAPVDRLARILELAKQKLGATSDDDAKMKVMEATNLPFLESKFDAILAELERR